MVIKAVDPNKAGNPGLVNWRKILLRQYSGMLNTILKNHLKRTSFTSLNPKSNMYEYKDEVSGRQITCGLVKLKLAFEVINPPTGGQSRNKGARIGGPYSHQVW